MEIVLTVREARELKNIQFFGTQDPYCVCTVGKQFHAKTHFHDNGGRSPWWNESFVIPMPETIPDKFDLQLRIKNANHAFLPDTFIGTAQLDMENIVQNRNTDTVYQEWLPVYRHRRPAGEISVRIEFKPTGDDDFRANIVNLSTTSTTSTKVN